MSSTSESSRRPAHSNQMRAAIVAIALLGLALLGAGAAELVVNDSASAVANLVRPELSDEGLALHRQDYETAERTLSAVREEIIPAVGGELGLPEAVVLAGLALQYPDVARVLAEEEEMQTFAEATLLNLERQQANFQSADSLPASWLPPWTGAALGLLAGVVLLGAAFAMWSLAGRWQSAVLAAGTAGLVLAVFALACRVPWKAAAAETVLDSLNPSEAVAQRTEEYVDLTQAGMTQFTEELLPDAAATLDITEAELRAELEERFPGVAADLDAMPEILERYEARAAIRSGGAADLRLLKELPLGLLGWTHVVLGGLVVVVAVWADRAGRGTEDLEGTSAAGAGNA